ncbi:glycoprotein Xg [Phacochoerus africanus]|uniref:glycoprotein Xg n=1 Tax=Phacochoerus africanus TaxID=41426 RepID=UPI001FD93CCB|nr:glycoprotein Xg [Phacochoerus africanus]
MARWRGLFGLSFLCLLMRGRGQGDFDLADALDDPEPTKKPSSGIYPRPKPPYPPQPGHPGNSGDIYPRPKPPYPPQPGHPGNSGGAKGFFPVRLQGILMPGLLQDESLDQSDSPILVGGGWVGGQAPGLGGNPL